MDITWINNWICSWRIMATGKITMNDFYKILDLLYKFNHKMPEISFGALMHNLITKEEKLWYLTDEEIIQRLEEFLKDDNE